MRIVKTRAALLSDFEVLQLLRDTEAQQRASTRSDGDSEAWMKAVPPNVRTIQFEVRPKTDEDHRLAVAGASALRASRSGSYPSISASARTKRLCPVRFQDSARRAGSDEGRAPATRQPRSNERS